jgi:site-specific DNA-methyltransferase (adenine-specific)
MRRYGDEPNELGIERKVEGYLDRLLEMFRECLRVCKPTGSVVFNLGDRFIRGSFQLLPYHFAIEAKKYANLTNNVIWTKPNPWPLGARGRLVPSHEECLHFTKSSRYYFNPDAFAKDRGKPTPSRHRGQRYFGLIDESDLSDAEKTNAKRALAEVIEDVQAGKCKSFCLKLRGVHTPPINGDYGWICGMRREGFAIIRKSGKGVIRDVLELPTSNTKSSGHPAPFPLGLPTFFINLLTRPGDVVLDPFIGSGTTAVAAKNLERHWIGFDLSPQYIEQARKRLA